MSSRGSSRVMKSGQMSSLSSEKRQFYSSEKLIPTRMTAARFMLPTPADADPEVNWHSFLDFSAAAMCFLLHPHGSSTFTLQVYNRGGAFAAMFAGLTVLLGGPILLYEVALGQCTLAHPVNAFRICPLVQGLGYGMLVCAIMMVAFENLTLGGAAMFAVIALATPHQLVNAQVPAVYQEGIPGDPGVPPVYKLYENHVGGLHYLHGQSYGKFRYELMGCVLASWMLIFITGIGSSVSYSKTVFFGVLLPLEVFMFWLMVAALREPGAVGASREVFSVTTLPDFEMWVMALLHSLTSLGAGCGLLIRLASLSRFRWPQRAWWAYGFALLLTAKELLFAGLTTASLGANVATRGASIHTVLHMEIMGLELKVLAVGLHFVSFPYVWSIVVFLLFWIAEIYYSLLLLRWVVAGTWALPYVRRGRRLRVPITLVYCLGFLAFGVYCCFRNTAGYAMTWEMQQPKWALSVLCMIEIMAGVYCYGLKDLMLAFKEAMGYFPDLYTRICWLILPLAILIATLVSINLAYDRRMNLDRITCSRFDCVEGLSQMVVVLVPVALIALNNIRIYSLRGTLASLLKPKPVLRPEARPASSGVRSAGADTPGSASSGLSFGSLQRLASYMRSEPHAEKRAEPQTSPHRSASEISTDASKESNAEISTSRPR